MPRLFIFFVQMPRGRLEIRFVRSGKSISHEQYVFCCAVMARQIFLSELPPNKLQPSD
jgi:hypothetical protein